MKREGQKRGREKTRTKLKERNGERQKWGGGKKVRNGEDKWSTNG